VDWIITIPKTVSWDTYQQELDAARDWKVVLNYRTRYFPKEMTRGDRCFIVHDGQVRGWMEVVGLDETKGFTCRTTGIEWPAGKYIQRSGPFHPVSGVEMQGFRGIRKYEKKGR